MAESSSARRLPPSSEVELELALSEPTTEATQAMSQLPGDLLLLGAGGKMGLALAQMALRAARAAGSPRKVIAVSRFSNPAAREKLDRLGVDTIACDLLREGVLKNLPDAALVCGMTGFKFGASARPHQAWATNCLLPALICERYRQARVAAFSSGNVYGLTPVAGGGSRESDTPRPVGEYAWTALGRERLYVFGCEAYGPPVALLRLNYAVDLRYGVLVDLAKQVRAEQPIDLTMGYVNVIWQRDACAMALAAFGAVERPAAIYNVAGPEMLRVRDVAARLGQLLGKTPRFVGEEAPDALLNNGDAARARLGRPTLDADTLIEWVAHWLGQGLPTWNKPTAFQNRAGDF